MATSITSAAELFVQKCITAGETVAGLIQKKIQNPGSIINFQASGAIVEAVSGNLGPIKSYGESYIKNNAEALVIEALDATTIGGVNVGQSAKDGLDFFLNTLSSSVAVYNDLLLILTKQSARRIIQDLETKQAIRTELLEKLNAYVNTLEQMRKGPSVFEAYLDQLREALIKIDEGGRELTTVTSTLRATDRFLGIRFQNAKDLLNEAEVLIKPTDNPYLDPKFLSNQTIVEKTTTGNTRNDITGELVDGKVDPGNPEFLEGSFGSAEVGDFVRVTFPITSEISPINQGVYNISTKVSTRKVQLKGPIISVGLSGGEIPFVVGYGPSTIKVSGASIGRVQPGDRVIWEGDFSFDAVVASTKITVVPPQSIILDRAVDPALLLVDSVEGTFRIERGPLTNIEEILDDSPGVLERGTPIEELPSESTPLFNSQFQSTDPITGIIYQISRQDGLQVDLKTLIDSSGAFLDQNVVGQFLKIISPSNIKGSYKIEATLNDTSVRIVNPLPNVTGPISGIEYEIKADLGIPLDKDQFANIMAIPAMTNAVVLSAKAYFGATLRANAGLEGFPLALDALLSSLPAVMKKYVLKLMDRAVQNTDILKGNMSTILNGSPNISSLPFPSENGTATSVSRTRITVTLASGGTETFEIPSGFGATIAEGDTVSKGQVLVGNKTNPITVSSFTFKWAMDINLIIAAIGLVPAEALTKINLSSEPVTAYRNTVERLNLIDDFVTSNAIVTGEDGKEDILQLETQLFTLLTQGNTLIFTGELREEIISLGRSIIRNIELARLRDDDVIQVLETWIAFPIPLEDEMNEILDGLNGLLKNLGLDKAAALFSEGKFEELLGLNNGKAATFIGAALSGLALLKDCFDTPEESEDLDEIINELQKEEQLLDVQFSIDFDLQIFQAIKDCTRFGNLSNLLNLKEIFCGLAQEAVGGKLDAVRNSVDNGTTGPGQKSASNTIGL